ncbi:MAG: sigma factor-like helix-turn-helix DNA-binding protein, partial [Bacteroidota bacterium]
ALIRLPEKCKIAFEYSRNDQLTYPQIAQKMDISIKTVEAHLGKALRSLRAELAEYLIVTILIILF